MAGGKRMSEQYTKEQQVANVPFFIHEATVERLEQINKRWFKLALVIFILFVLTNAGWLVYESQFEAYNVEQEVDSGTGSAYVTGLGDLNYGQGEAAGQGTSTEYQQ
jgi:hypothetical protein